MSQDPSEQRSHYIQGGTLVTGGACHIGSHVVWLLIAVGAQAIVLDDLSTGFEEAVTPGADLMIGDTGNQALVPELLGKHRID